MLQEFKSTPAWEAANGALISGDKDELKTLGAMPGNKPDESPYFSSLYYRSQVGQIIEPSPMLDFIMHGSKRNLSPHWAFDEEYYIARDARVRSAKNAENFITALQHYIRSTDCWKIRPHPAIDPIYISERDDRSKQYNDPIEYLSCVHFSSPMAHISSLFDQSWYEHAAQDFSHEVGFTKRYRSWVEHFLAFGIFENIPSIPDFDNDYYCRTNPEIVDALNAGRLRSSFLHYIRYGISENRDPNRFFDSRYYLNNNPRVAQEIETFGLLGPFEHFLRFGRARNLQTSEPRTQILVDVDAAKSIYERRCVSSVARLDKGIALKNADVPELTIVIPVYNHYPMTARFLECVAGLQARTDCPALEVIVVDNGSSDSTTELARTCPGITVLRYDEPLGYTKACNRGGEHATGKYILFSNNDVEFDTDAVIELFEVVSSKNCVGGGKIIQMNETLQEAGCSVYQNGGTQGYGRGDNPWLEPYNKQRRVDFVSGCWMMLSRKLFKKLKGFDEDFAPGYYEETDLCMRAWESGHEVIYVPESEIHHYEYASYSKGRPPTISQRLIRDKREVFRSKHLDKLPQLTSPRLVQSSAAAWSREDGYKHIAIIDDLLPDPGLGSGFGRARDIFDLCGEEGCIRYLLINSRRPGVREDEIGLMNIPVTYTHNDPRQILNELRKIGPTLDVLWISRTHNGELLYPYADEIRLICPNARIVFDTEAIAATREAALMRQKGMEVDDTWLSHNIRREVRFDSRADVTIVVNDNDKAILASVTGTQAEVLGHCFEDLMDGPDFADRSGILFFGSIHDVRSPNLDSLIWMTEDVMPIVLESVPDATLAINGYIADSVMSEELPSADWIKYGGVAKDLKPVCDQHKVFVAPTRFAGGIPHKVQHALSMGIPAVVTELLADQLGYGRRNRKRQPYPILSASETDAEAFAAKIVTLLTDEQAWKTQRDTGTKYVRSDLSTEAFRKKLNEIIGLK